MIAVERFQGCHKKGRILKPNDFIYCSFFRKHFELSVGTFKGIKEKRFLLERDKSKLSKINMNYVILFSLSKNLMWNCRRRADAGKHSDLQNMIVRYLKNKPMFQLS